MCDPLLYRGKRSLSFVKKQRQRLEKCFNGEKKTCLIAMIVLAVAGILGEFWSLRFVPFAQATVGKEKLILKDSSPLFAKQQIFQLETEKNKTHGLVGEKIVLKQTCSAKLNSGELENNLLELVGETPMREMVPFIAKRESKVAAFLVGIAKKESSFGLASPSKDGSTCFNYWGYKGVGSRGASLGYSCFGSAQEAVEVVGNRLEMLIARDRNTPAKMVDTWKCGHSCIGDPGAPSWVSTVAMYFEKIVKMEG